MKAEKSEPEKRPVFCTTCKSWYICNALDYWPVASGNNRCKNWEIADKDEIARRQKKEIDLMLFLTDNSIINYNWLMYSPGKEEYYG